MKNIFTLKFNYLKLFTAIFINLLVVNVYASEVIIVDGDTLKLSGITYRLHGNDAPEHGQKCKKK